MKDIIKIENIIKVRKISNGWILEYKKDISPHFPEYIIEKAFIFNNEKEIEIEKVFNEMLEFIKEQLIIIPRKTIK